MLMSLCYWGKSDRAPHSGKNGTSVAFAKIYVEIRNNGTSVMHSQKFTFKNQMTTYKSFRMCVHHANSSQSSLLVLHIRPVCVFITRSITYVRLSSYMKNYHGSLLTLVMHENILMDREERLRRK